MSFKWPHVRLGDLAEITSSKRIKRADYVTSGVPFFRSKEVIERSKGNEISTELFISNEQFSKIRNKFGAPEAGDILLTSVGTLGVPYQVRSTDRFYFKDGNLTWLRKFKDSALPEYVLYWIRSPSAQRKLDEVSIGSTQRALTIVALKSVELPLPPKAVQTRIVDIAKSLDQKLETNRGINQTLEQMAQAIYKSWFVDFEPVKVKIAALEAGDSEEDALLAAMHAISGKDEIELANLQTEQPEQYAELHTTAELFPSAMQDSELGEIPEGWKVGPLAELIQFNPRRSLKKGTPAPYLDMKNVPTSGHLAEDVVLREMNSGTKFINGDTLLARITPCLENGKTAYVDFLEEGQVGWGSTEYIVMRSQEPYPESISYFIARDTNFRQHAIQSMTGTSGRQRANAKALAELPWITYPRVFVEAFNQIASPYLELAKSHGNQSKSLAAMRDALLPKLLSGELSVADAGNQIAQAEETADV